MRDLESRVKGHSRPLKPASFKSLCVLSYSPSIVTMMLSCIVFEIFSVKRGVTLKIGLGFVQGGNGGNDAN